MKRTLKTANVGCEKYGYLSVEGVGIYA